MIKRKKLVCLFVALVMVVTMIPGEALAANVNVAAGHGQVSKNEDIDVTNLESQLWALDETTEQRDLIKAQAEKNFATKDINSENGKNVVKPLAPGSPSERVNPEDSEKPENPGEQVNPENTENPGENVDPEPPIDPNDPEVLKWKIGSIDKIPMQLFDEKAVEGIQPELVVRDGNGDPMTHHFYDATWENNKAVGLAKVTVAGKNGCEGTASQEFYIVKSFTPDKLKITKVETDLGRAKIHFKGTSVGDMKIGYEVRCKKVGDIYDESFNFQKVNGSVVVSGLEYNKRYEFRVKAYYFNDKGDYVDGPLSDKVIKWTNRLGNKQQTIATAGFTKATLGKSSVKLNIKKIKLADAPNLDIGYRINFRIKGYSNYRYVDTKDLVKTFYNLDRGVDYQFRVKYYYISKLDGKRVYSPSSPAKNVRLSFKVNKVLDIARSWLGRRESNGTHKYIIDLYNSHKPLARGYKVKYTDEWCATTISAMFIKAKAVSLPGGTECSVQRYIDIYKKRGVWEEDGRIKPKAGYIITYNWDDRSQAGGNNGWADHIGIVEKVRGNKITVIEGNYGEKVARRTIPVGWGYIRGYAKLNYATKSTVWNSK